MALGARPDGAYLGLWRGADGGRGWPSAIRSAPSARRLPPRGERRAAAGRAAAGSQPCPRRVTIGAGDAKAFRVEGLRATLAPPPRPRGRTWDRPHRSCRDRHAAPAVAVREARDVMRGPSSRIRGHRRGPDPACPPPHAAKAWAKPSDVTLSRGTRPGSSAASLVVPSEGNIRAGRRSSPPKRPGSAERHGFDRPSGRRPQRGCSVAADAGDAAAPDVSDDPGGDGSSAAETIQPVPRMGGRPIPPEEASPRLPPARAMRLGAGGTRRRRPDDGVRALLPYGLSRVCRDRVF